MPRIHPQVTKMTAKGLNVTDAGDFTNGTHHSRPRHLSTCGSLVRTKPPVRTLRVTRDQREVDGLTKPVSAPRPRKGLLDGGERLFSVNALGQVRNT